MNAYLKQIEAATRATVIHSRAMFSWFGKRCPLLSANLMRALPSETAREFLISKLQDHLYQNFYCRGMASSTKWELSEIRGFALKAPYVAELSKANKGTGYWSSGWQVRSMKASKILVSQDELLLWVDPANTFPATDETLTPGSYISIRFPKEFPDLSPGFYLAAANVELKHADWLQSVRLYWNVTPAGGVQLMRMLTTELNRMELPFRLKVQRDFSPFPRCDTAVLYIRKDDYSRIHDVLRDVYAELDGELRSGTPVFTKALAPGLGLAEEPLRGTSFGLDRCRVLAEGLVTAYDDGRRKIDEQVQAVCNRFALAKVSVAEPFLNEGSVDIYRFDAPTFSPAPVRQHAYEEIKDVREDRFLMTAYEIGRELCRQAIYFDGRCNWMGTSAKDVDNKTYCTLTPELYAGTSGVALFLAELYELTGDPTLKRTSLAAIRQALSKVGDVPPAARLGAYSGWVGIALAATRVGFATQSEQLLRSARELLNAVVTDYGANLELDLISGKAGAIAALVCLHSEFSDDSLLEFSLRLGDQLLEASIVCDDGYCWRTVNATNEIALTGFSHGAAGIGYALLELFNATGEIKYREAAVKAFNYERSWFEPRVGNWPDLREVPRRHQRGDSSLPFSAVWCHGAPGIALSRLRAYDLLGEQQYKNEALTALTTTINTTQSSLLSRSLNFSLCHGVAGNADVLLIASQILGKEFPQGLEVARRFADGGLSLYGALGKEWPCGAGGGPTPSLMLGFAGIGYFYLRLHKSTIPSPLILHHGIAANLAQLEPEYDYAADDVVLAVEK